MTKDARDPSPTPAAIAVVGVGALFPGSTDAAGFWRDIVRGTDLIGDVPATHWLTEDYYDPDPAAPDKTYARRGAFLGPVQFDTLKWGVPPTIVPATDTAQLLSLLVAEQVLTDVARASGEAVDPNRVSVILGATSAQELYGNMVSRLQRPVWVKALRDAGLGEDQVQSIAQRIADHYVPWQESTFPGLLGNVIAGRIANRLNLGGTNCVTDAACASSFSAVAMAVSELLLGQSDMVVVGGVDAMNDILMFMCFAKTPALSPSGDCRPFSDRADGTMLGEGIGMMALKRLADAERDGNHVYAVLRGVGTSSDGRALSVYAPVAAGQAKALRRAYDQAGYSPATVELVEAHGTGTRAGDAAEVEALVTVFDEAARQDRQWCALGSVKSQIGHTKAASGAAGLFKAVMALHHRVLPPTIKVERPNPQLGLERSPFYLNTAARPWVRGSDHPRRAGVSSFGFGGANFHLTLEEYTGPGRRPPRLRALDHELVLVTGRDGGEVAERARLLAAGVRPGSLAWLAWSSQQQPAAAAAARLALVVPDETTLASRLTWAAERIALAPSEPFASPNGCCYGVGPGPVAGEVAFLFPGQGSQYVGMGAAAAMAFDAARAVWDRAADLSFDAQLPLHQVVFPRPAFGDEERDAQLARLTATEWAQPAIGTVSLALLAVLAELGLTPAMVGGHSFGDVTALHAAGVLSADDLLRVARRRGEVMAEAARVPGAMAAVARTLPEVRALIERLALDVVVANHNAPTQVVLSGTTAAVDEAVERLLAERVTATRLPVATGFHSAVVAASVEPFLARLADVDFAAPARPAYANATAAPYPAEPELARRCLAEQIASPVRFVDQVEAMHAAGARLFVEVGPSAVLTGLVDQILGDRPHLAVNLDRKGEDGLRSLLTGLGRLVAAGVELDLAALWQGYAVPVEPVAADASKASLTLVGANYGKPYPPPNGAAGLPAPNPVTVVPPAAAPAPVAGAPILAESAWLAAFEETQRQTAEAHAAYQRAMTESHTAFLATAEATLHSLAAALGGAGPAPRPERPTTPPVSFVPPPAPFVPPPVVVAAAAPPVVVPVAVAAAVDVAALVLAVVAEKTGYPEDMLALDMDLEGDLGIDSIKRVEILSAVVERAPGLPEVETSAMVGIRTLAEIVALLGTLAPVAVAAAPAPAAVDLAALLLAVVAEKTGYPEDMLSLDMDLESDLGVDSIKRVEILSAVVDRAPGRPEVETAAMVGVRTLAEILGLLGAVASSAPAAPAPPAVAVPTRSDVAALLVAVVAEKTGYPEDMLSLDMDLEGDLGIDSIKRVEILSAMVERVPELPEVEAAAMVGLRRLEDIVAYLERGPLDVVVPVAAPSAAGWGRRPPPPKRPPPPARGRGAGGARGAPPPPPAPRPATAGVLGRHAVEVVPAPALGMAQPGLIRGGLIAVTDDGGGEAEALVEALDERGVRAAVVDAVPRGAGGVILLDGLGTVAGVDDALAVSARALAVARQFAGRGALFVTVQDTGGRFAVGGRGAVDGDRAWLGALAGLAKTAAQEWVGVSVKAIDLERGERGPRELAAALVNELLSGGPELEVGLAADGRRSTLRAVPAEVGPGMPVVDAASVLVVSGGARGVTAACVLALARAARPRLVLLGRTPLDDQGDRLGHLSDPADLRAALLLEARERGEKPTPVDLQARLDRYLAQREIKATLAAVEAAGSAVRYCEVDVADSPALADLLESVREEWGPITGVIHGAGVLSDRLIADLEPGDLARVYRPKVEGLRVLLDATAGDPLRLLLLFSSVAGRTGNPGQAAYAMANEILNKVAQAEQARRGPACVVRALGWGPWDGGMVSPELAARFAARGVPLLPLAAGAEMLVAEATGRVGAPVEVVLGAAPAALVAPSDGSGREFALDLVVNRGSHPYLAAHAMGGTPVVPVVLAVEWFARVARALRPDLHLARLHDLRVLKGIRLDGFNDGGDRLVLSGASRATEHGVALAMTVCSPDGTPHYTATAELVARRDAPSVEVPCLELGGWNGHPVYGGVLFHGPEFQVIRAVDGISDEGVVATLAGMRERRWSTETWRTDAASFDGGLQLALLWSEHVLGGASLPTSIDEVLTFTDELTDGPVRCVLKGREAANGRCKSDLVFCGANGVPVAEMRGVETHVLPGGR